MEQTKTTDNKELAWVNSLKFVCIIFIFYYHSDVYCSGKGDVGNEIYYFAPFYTNLFFFLSGYLLFKKQWNAPLISMGRKEWYNFNKSGGGRVFLHNIVFKIAIPTLFFSLLYFFPKTVLRGEGFSSVALIEQTFLGGAIWFTSALTVAELVIFVLLLLRSNSSLLWIIIGVMLMCISNYITHEHFQLFGSDDLPWFYKSGFISVAFMIVGGIYWRVENRCGSVKYKLGGGNFVSFDSGPNYLFPSFKWAR